MRHPWTVWYSFSATVLLFESFSTQFYPNLVKGTVAQPSTGLSMTIRKAALVAAIGCAIALVPAAYIFFLGVFSLARLVHFALWTIGVFIPAIVLFVFFVFLYGEASGRIKSEARGIAAITAAALMLVVELYVIWVIHESLRFRMSLVLFGNSILFVRRLLWVAIFIGFSANILPAMSRMISKLAAALVICYVAFISLIWYEQVRYPTPRSTAGAHSFWLNARLLGVFNVIQWASVPVLLVFLIIVWRRWQAQLSVHENVLG